MPDFDWSKSLLDSMQYSRQARADRLRKQLEQQHMTLQRAAADRAAQAEERRLQHDQNTFSHQQQQDALRQTHENYAELSGGAPELRQVAARYPEAGARPYIGAFEDSSRALARDPNALLRRSDQPGGIGFLPDGAPPQPVFQKTAAPAPAAPYSYPGPGGDPEAPPTGVPSPMAIPDPAPADWKVPEFGPSGGPMGPFPADATMPAEVVHREAGNAAEGVLGMGKLAAEDRAQARAKALAAMRQHAQDKDKDRNKFLLSQQNALARTERDLAAYERGQVQLPTGEWKFISEITATPEEKARIVAEGQKQRALLATRRKALQAQLEQAGLPSLEIDPQDYVEQRAAQGVDRASVAAELRNLGHPDAADELERAGGAQAGTP